jgi:hypothetical protein
MDRDLSQITIGKFTYDAESWEDSDTNETGCVNHYCEFRVKVDRAKGIVYPEIDAPSGDFEEDTLQGDDNYSAESVFDSAAGKLSALVEEVEAEARLREENEDSSDSDEDKLRNGPDLGDMFEDTKE